MSFYNHLERDEERKISLKAHFVKQIKKELDYNKLYNN